MTHPATIALLLPIISFAVLTLVKPLRKSVAPAGYFSALMTLNALGSSIAALLEFRATGDAYIATVPWLVNAGQAIAEVGVRLDGISATMMVVVGVVASCAQIYSLGYLHDEPKGSLGRYYTWQSLFLFAMSL